MQMMTISHFIIKNVAYKLSLHNISPNRCSPLMCSPPVGHTFLPSGKPTQNGALWSNCVFSACWALFGRPNACMLAGGIRVFAA